MKNKNIISFCLALSFGMLTVACNSNNTKKIDRKNKESMMPDTTGNLLRYDSTKTEVGR